MQEYWVNVYKYNVCGFYYTKESAMCWDRGCSYRIHVKMKPYLNRKIYPFRWVDGKITLFDQVSQLNHLDLINDDSFKNRPVNKSDWMG